MTKDLWVNLPVKNIKKSKKFFSDIGFLLKPVPGNDEHAACIVIGTKNVVIMLFEHADFKSFSACAIADATQNNEVLLSIDAESKEEVDEFARRVVKAGGTIYGEPGLKDGWMYGCGFIDPDGHRWSILYMDMSKMGN